MSEKNVNRRQFLKTTAGVFSSFAATGLSSSKLFAKESYDTVRIGYLPITDATPLLVAHGNGYFSEEGLKVLPPVLIRSWSALSESFLSGKFNVTHLLFPIPVWMRYNIKAPVKVIAWDHINGSALTVSNDSGINSFADLGGKKIAVPHWYSMHNIILQAGIRKMGLTPVIQSQDIPLKPHEVNLFILPPPDMPLSLAGKKIDGYIVAEPFNAIGEVKINARILRFTGDIWKNHPCCVVVMNEDIIKRYPIFTQKVTNAIVRAQRWILENPLKTAHMLSREGNRYLPVQEDILKRVFTLYDPEIYSKNKSAAAIRHPEWQVKRIGFQPYPFPSATRYIINEMGQTRMEGDTRFLKTLDPDFAVTDLVNDSFVKKAILSAGGPSFFDNLSTANPWEREEVIEL
ncbi:MAG: ABC transporter substrate-binding protein [Proteobacteria bacterium]|nr:ABC transporter substrate-binding protein [Pseudomonadota bacterium]